jgi:hypothetical protein
LVQCGVLCAGGDPEIAVLSTAGMPKFKTTAIISSASSLR